MHWTNCGVSFWILTILIKAVYRIFSLNMFFIVAFTTLGEISIHCIVLILKQVLVFLNDVFDTLLKALSDPSDEVYSSTVVLLPFPVLS